MSRSSEYDSTIARPRYYQINVVFTYHDITSLIEKKNRQQAKSATPDHQTNMA